MLFFSKALKETSKVDTLLETKKWGVRGVMDSVVGNGHSDTSSNPKRHYAFPIVLIPLEKVWI